jgi:hypothetical protein
MCTVVFIPNKAEKYFASLRDESPIRPIAIPPSLYAEGELKVLATKDPLAGGTWIGMNDFQNVIILLNGAFQNHAKDKMYDKSRGIIVAELLKTEMPVIEWSILDLVHVEPFTLVIWSDNNLFELVWDGENKQRKLLDHNAPHIWSSSTLYNQKAKQTRKILFQQWIALNPIISKESLFEFFTSFHDQENGFIMNRRESVKTLSYSFITMEPALKALFEYNDFRKEKQFIQTLEFKSEAISCELQSLLNQI